MANTYTQLHFQFVFATKYRRASIHPLWKEQLHSYITSIIQDNGHKMLQINSMPDHIHILVGMRPHESISSLMQEVKSESTKWIKEKKFTPVPFAWQEGYGAFSYNKNQIPDLILYIQHQENHHLSKSFIHEYRQILTDSGIDFDERYIFKDPS